MASIAKRLEGKVAIVTGGASGIGEAATRLFIKHGAKVVIADIQDDLGQSIIKEIGENKVISYVHCDVKVEKDVENVVDMTVSKYGKVDIMFSNAGVPEELDSTILKIDYEIFKKVFDVNVFGTLMCAKHAARVMIPAKKGSIIFTLEGKIAIITGGASGIGEVATRLFIKHGAKVVIAHVQDDNGQFIIEEIGENRDVSYVHCDVKVDIMFSNAGIPGKPDTTILKSDYENFKSVFDVNVFGAFMCAKHAARVMIPPKKGSIIFTSSIASVTYGDVAHTYLASKHAIVGLAKNLVVELGQHGIRVNCVSPFGVATPMVMNSLGIKDKEKVEEFVSQIANLKGTILEAEDVAQATLYLASDESKYISGMNIVIDGGYSTTNVALKQAIRKMAVLNE